MGPKRLRYGFLALPLLFFTTLFAADLEPLTIRDFSAGLHTTKNSADIPNGASQDCENVDVWKGTIETRRGSVLQNSTSTIGGFTSEPVRFMHEYVDQSNNTWLMTVSSGSLYGSKDAGVTYTLLSTTHGHTSLSQFNAVNAFGNCYLTDGATHWMRFDGSVVDVATTSLPRGAHAAFYAERLWLANASGARSTLYGSGYGDPTDWVNDGYDSDLNVITTDEDAFTQNIRQDDGYNITALVNYGPGLVIFKDFSMDMFMTAPDGITFTLTPISNTIGTAHSKSVRVVNNELIFLSVDGYKAYNYNTNQIRSISDDIQQTVDSILQLNSTTRVKSYTSQLDFSGGVFNFTSASISDGDIVLSTWSHLDTDGDDFSSGTTLSIDTYTSTGDIYLSTNAVDVNDNNFENGDCSVEWAFSETHANCDAAFAYSGTMGVYLGATPLTLSKFVLDIYGGDGMSSPAIYSKTYYPADLSTSWEQKTVSMLPFRGRNYMFRFTTEEAEGVSYSMISKSTYVCSGEDFQFWVKRTGDTYAIIALDLLTGGVTSITSGTYTSPGFNTTFSTPSWKPTTPVIHPNGNKLRFHTQTSPDNAAWDDAVIWTTGTSPASNHYQYIRYVVTMETNTYSSALPYASSVGLEAVSSTGSWVSDSFPLGSINSWGLFLAGDTPNNGNITYSLYTDTDNVKYYEDGLPTAASFVSSQTITSNETPNISTNSYAFIASTFTVSVSTYNPEINNVEQIWYEGGANFPVASLEYDGDYLSSVAISTTAGNDKILVYDRNGRWTKYSGLNAYCMTKYRQKPYLGSYREGRVYRFQANGAANDNGTAISWYWTSKDFDYGYPVTDKTLQRYYVTARRDVNSDATFSYGVNQGALTTKALDLDEYSGFYRKTIIPSSLTYSKGIQHRFKFSDSDLDDTCSIQSVTVKQRLETDP